MGAAGLCGEHLGYAEVTDFDDLLLGKETQEVWWKVSRKTTTRYLSIRWQKQSILVE